MTTLNIYNMNDILGSLLCLRVYTNALTSQRKIFINAVNVLTGPSLDLIGNPVALPFPPQSLLNTNPPPAHSSVGPVYANLPSAHPPTPQWPYPHPHPSPPTAPVVASTVPDTCMPISGLSEYSPSWSLRVRVTSKSLVKVYTNARGEGKLFSADLADAHGGRIRCTFFNGAVDKFLDVVQENGVYDVAGGTVKLANPAFALANSLHELSMDEAATVTRVADDGSIPPVRVTLTRIRDLRNCTKNSPVDVLAVITAVSEVKEIISKTGKKAGQRFTFREVDLADDSLCGVKLKLWGEVGTAFTGQTGDILLARGALVDDFGGSVSLKNGSSTSVGLDPPMPEAAALRRWWAAQAPAQQVEMLSRGSPSAPVGPLEYRTLAEVEAEIAAKDTEAQGMQLLLRCTLSGLRPASYPACSTCSTKVIQAGGAGDRWQCTKCHNPEAEMKRRFILTMVVSDATGSREVTAFDEVASVVLSCTAAEWQLKSPADQAIVMHDLKFQPYKIQCVINKETGAARTGMRLQAMVVEHLNLAEDSRELLRLLTAA